MIPWLPEAIKTAVAAVVYALYDFFNAAGKFIVDDNNEVHLTDTQIIRCKDCIFYDTVHLDCARRGWTDCDRNGFCSYGERKEVKNAIS